MQHHFLISGGDQGVTIQPCGIRRLKVTFSLVNRCNWREPRYRAKHSCNSPNDLYLRACIFIIPLLKAPHLSLCVCLPALSFRQVGHVPKHSPWLTQLPGARFTAPECQRVQPASCRLPVFSLFHHFLEYYLSSSFIFAFAAQRISLITKTP